ncbi:hypothetical protein [Kistimonas asteriae]|uniref:hypothetical protein n=1 Tax=Kistimonas asteriae TaxID=517724 RepID=UPI001BA65A49|nr:hypothetical protein [Kistimonas asteriae]
MQWQSLSATVTAGYGVASGKHPDPRFPEGSLSLQLPQFETLGLNLSGYFRGTLNLSIAPASYRIITPYRCFRGVKWCDAMPPEDFSFFRCQLGTHTKNLVEGYVYYPHPETKPDHFQSPDILEVITQPLERIHYGEAMTLLLHTDELKVI